MISHSWREHRPHKYTDGKFVVVVVVVVVVAAAAAAVVYIRSIITVPSTSLCNYQ